MALRINTNVTALNAHMNLAINDDRLSGSIEKISSGLRINRAADDAAGLTISEKLRTQVRGINRALMNTQDGISLIQTAEGAMNEIHSMLQRVRELALQSSNDTLTTTDRLEIQKEVMQLKEDINRISYGTEFNTRRLLDGSGTANISTSSPTNMDGVVTGEVLTFSDFSVVVYPQSVNVPGVGLKVMRGTAESQRSNIFTRTDGVIASGTTTLQSIANFFDRNGNFMLDIPQTLYVQGDNQQGKFIISKDLTLNQLAERMQGAMTADQLGQGLHFDGSTAQMMTYGESNGQINVTSGKMGNVGRVNFTGEQDLIGALGFQQVIVPEDPVYSIAVTNMGVDFGARKTLTTQIAGHRAVGLIAGVDLVFQPPTQAFAQTVSATLGISIDAAFNFNVDDSVSSTGTVAISIPAGLFAMTQIMSIANAQLTAGASQVRAKLNDHYAIEFYTLNTGSAAYVSVSTLTLSPNPLGIANGRFSGTGGNPGKAAGVQPVSNFDYTLGNVVFSIQDSHDIANNTRISLTSNYAAGGMTSLVDAINSQIIANNLQIRAFNNNGTLELRSLETGVESNFLVTDVSNTLANVFIGTQNTISGFDGNPADQSFAYSQIASQWGYDVPEDALTAAVDNLSFYVADLDGRGMSIAIPSGDPALGQSFRTITSIANLLNATASLNGVKVAAEIITSNQTLKIFSTVPGSSGKVTFAEWGSPDSVNTLKKTLNIDTTTYANGNGDYSYTMHIKDSFMMFQIGPNEGHFAKANIVRTDIVALGIRDIDLTTVKSAQEAIGLCDKALQYISSERAKLGAIENRMTYTTNSLQVGLQNMTASESRIRDVDVAKEVISLTKFQILQQSAQAMLGQANVSAQRVLDLLK